MLAILAALVVGSGPASCERLWERTWADLLKESPRDKEPFFTKIPNARERLRKAWIEECGRFSKETFACARGEVLDQEVAEMRRMGKGLMPRELDEIEARIRGEWKIFDCKEVDRSIDRAAAAVGRDAGFEPLR